jgi:hypothetical protein
MSKMMLVVVAAVAALFGSALFGSALTLIFGVGLTGAVPVQAAEGMRMVEPIGQKRGAPASPATRSAFAVTRAAMERRVQARFSGTDSNRDGFVSQIEAQAAEEKARTERRTSAFGAMDADKSGSISRDEFEARANQRRDLFKQGGFRRDRFTQERGKRSGEQRQSFIGVRQFDRLDADKDGRVSLTDAMAPATARFLSSDTNGDGSLSADERKAARQKYRGERRVRQERRGVAG